MASKSYPRAGYNGGFITSAEHERLVHAAQPEGLFGHPNDPAPVFADGTGTRLVKVRAGLLAYVRGSVYDSGSTDTALPALAANTSGQPRIDLVVLRLNRSDYTITEQVITGTPAAAPVAPSPVLDGTTTGFFDFPLAQVRVDNGVTAIPASAVTTRAWYIGSDGQIRCKTATRPNLETGRSVFDTEAGRWLVNNGSKWLTTAEDTGWINVAPASGWRTNRIAIRRFNGIAFFVLDVDRSGASLSSNVSSLICTLPAGFEPDSIGFHAPAAMYNAQLSGRIVVLPNRQVLLTAHPGLLTGRYFIASTSWPNA